MKIPGFPFLVALAAMISDLSPAVAAEPTGKAEEKPAKPEPGAAEKPAAEKPVLGLRAVADAAGDDTEAMTADGSPDRLHVRKGAIITAADVKEAFSYQEPQPEGRGGLEDLWPGKERKPRKPKADDPWQIMVTLTPEGAAKLKEASKTLIGKPMAIVVSGKLISAPTVQSELGESFVISGSFSEKEAKELAKKIRPAKKR